VPKNYAFEALILLSGLVLVSTGILKMEKLSVGWYVTSQT